MFWTRLELASQSCSSTDGLENPYSSPTASEVLGSSPEKQECHGPCLPGSPRAGLSGSIGGRC